MAMSRGGMGKEVAGARMKKRAMGASRQGKKMAPAAMMMPEAAMAAPPMAMKKGGKVDFSKIVQNKKTGKLSEKPGMMRGGMAEKKMMGGGMAMKPGAMGYKKGGMALMIVLGKGEGKGKKK